MLSFPQRISEEAIATYTKRQFVGVILTVVLLQGSFGLVKMWAARHSTHDGVDGVVGSAVSVIF